MVYALAENIDYLNFYSAKLGYESEITGIESIRKVNVIDGNKNYYAYLTDFNGTEGYYLIADNYILLDWQINKEEPFDNVEEPFKLYYNVYTGYYYENENSMTYSVNSNRNVISSHENNTYTGQISGPYNVCHRL